MRNCISRRANPSARDREHVLARRDGKEDEAAVCVGDALQHGAGRPHRQADRGAADRRRLPPRSPAREWRPRSAPTPWPAGTSAAASAATTAWWRTIASPDSGVLIVPIDSLAATMRPVIGMNSGASENSPLLIAAGEKCDVGTATRETGHDVVLDGEAHVHVRMERPDLCTDWRMRQRIPDPRAVEVERLRRRVGEPARPRRGLAAGPRHDHIDGARGMRRRGKIERRAVGRKAR